MTAHAPAASSAESALLTWPYPETDSPITLTVSAAIAITTSTGTQQFASCGNGVIYGIGAGSGNGGGIAGCTIELTSLGVGGAVIFESSTNGGGAWSTLTVTKISDGTTTTTANAPGAWYVATSTFTHIRVRATALTSGTITGGIFGNNCTGMLADQDYVIKCPVPITLSYPVIGGLKFSGGRHIVAATGGEISIPLQTSGSDTYSRAIYTEYCTGVFHFEGWYLHGVDLSDGFQLYSGEAIIQIQNCRAGDEDEPLTAHDLSGFTDKHPDAIEAEGGWRELRVDKFTCWSNYQGIFLNQVTTKHGRFTELRRCDLNGAVDGVPAGSKQLFFVGDESGRVIVEDFYVQPHPEKTNLNFWQTLFTEDRYYGLTSEPDIDKRAVVVAPTGLVNPSNASSPTSSRWIEEIAWPPKAAIPGHVKLGPPPAGEFVPAANIGCNYVSPGYRHIDEAKLFQEVGSPPLSGRAIRPAINKLKSWNMDPMSATAKSAPPETGRLYLVKLPVDETMYELSGLKLNVRTAGTGLTAGQSWLGLYDRRGNKIAASLDQAAAWATTGEKLAALTAISPYVLKYWMGGYGDFYFVGLLCNWTGTPPQFSAAFDSSAGEDAGVAAGLNLNVDGTGAGIGPTGKFVIRTIRYINGLTTLPATISFGSANTSSFAPLIGYA